MISSIPQATQTQKDLNNPTNMRLAILQVLLLTALSSGLDICHDPRTRDVNRTCTNPSYGVLIPSVHGNPYHALHDTLWAVSHYLRNCARHPLTLHVPTHTDLTICATPDYDPQPDWGYCVAYVLAKSVGADVETEDSSVQNAGKRQKCHRTETILREEVSGWPETFRGLNWFTDYGDGKGHVRMDRTRASLALRHIRSAVRRFYKIGNVNGYGFMVNVLVYDRGDVGRRKWENAEDVLRVLSRMPGLRITYKNRMPIGLGRQVKLFAGTDVFVGPHGAAMSNTVFMSEGTGIVEFKKECYDGGSGHRGAEWSAWHASLVGLRLKYVECERLGNISHRVDADVVGRNVAEMVHEIRKARFQQLAKKRKLMAALLSFSLLGLLVILKTHIAFAKRFGRRIVKGSLSSP